MTEWRRLRWAKVGLYTDNLGHKFWAVDVKIGCFAESTRRIKIWNSLGISWSRKPPEVKKPGTIFVSASKQGGSLKARSLVLVLDPPNYNELKKLHKTPSWCDVYESGVLCWCRWKRRKGRVFLEFSPPGPSSSAGAPGKQEEERTGRRKLGWTHAASWGTKRSIEEEDVASFVSKRVGGGCWMGGYVTSPWQPLAACRAGWLAGSRLLLEGISYVVGLRTGRQPRTHLSSQTMPLSLSLSLHFLLMAFDCMQDNARFDWAEFIGSSTFDPERADIHPPSPDSFEKALGYLPLFFYFRTSLHTRDWSFLFPKKGGELFYCVGFLRENKEEASIFQADFSRMRNFGWLFSFFGSDTFIREFFCEVHLGAVILKKYC